MTLARKPAEPNGFSTFKRRKPKPSKRSQDPVTPEVAALVKRRAGHTCEAGGSDDCLYGHHIHHRLPVAHGGSSGPENLLYLCMKHHGWTHQHPAEARRLGWLVGRREVPSQVPVRIRNGQTALLTDDGRYQEAP